MLHSASDDYPLTGTGTQHKPAGSAGRTGNTRADPIFTHSSPSRIQIAGNLLDQKTFFNLQLANQSGAICKYPRGRELQVQQRVREIRVQIRRGSASRGVERAVDRCWGAPSHAATGPAPRHKTGRQLAAAAAPHAAAATPATIRPNTITENTLGVRQGKTFVD